ncbi:MAG: hypothetical protein ACRDFQ_08260 [Anaerolineales bacterium]
MKSTTLTRLFSLLSLILIAWGIYFTAWGFEFFAEVGILPAESLVSWEGAIYGSMMIGWGVTLFIVGRIAIQRNDAETLKAILLGLSIWLILESVFSAYLKVWFNIGVALGVLALFGVVLRQAISVSSTKSKRS